jgi:hypothetical protein
MDNELEIVANEGLAAAEKVTEDQTKSLLTGGAIGFATGVALTVAAYFGVKAVKKAKAKKAVAAEEKSESKSEE